jgi:hypothetical protein
MHSPSGLMALDVGWFVIKRQVVKSLLSSKEKAFQAGRSFIYIRHCKTNLQETKTMFKN